jgi:hypothetical protein
MSFITDPEMKADMNGTREQFLDRKFKRYVKDDPRYQDLRDKLFSIGGTVYVPQPEEAFEELLTRGQIFRDKKPIRYACKTAALEQKFGLRRYSSDCHANIAYDYVRFCGKGFKIVTGYAIAHFDGDWRQHSWGLWKGHVVESTVLRRLYYGYVLTPEESVNFVFQVASDILEKDSQLTDKAYAFNRLVGKVVEQYDRKKK